MTISSTPAVVQYQGDNVSVTFTVPFYFQNNTDLVLTKRSSAGIDTVLVIGTDYSVSGAGNTNGGSVTLSVAPKTGTPNETLTIIADPIIQQQTHYLLQGLFPSTDTENALDLLTRIAQTLRRREDRSIRAPDADVLPGMLLPSAAVRASGVVTMDPAGNLLMLPASAIAGVAVAGIATVDRFTATANQTAFALSGTPGTINNIVASLDGAVLSPGDDYTWSAGGFTLLTGALAGQKLRVQYFGSVGVASVTPGTVGDAQLVPGSNVANASKQVIAEVSLASTATTDLGAQTATSILVTGTNTITSFGSSALASGLYYAVRFSGALLLTHNAVSLILPGNASITTAAGDSLTAKYEGASNWRVLEYNRATDIPTTSAGDTIRRGIAICKFKPALTARATTTALANDPDLAYAIPAAGTYDIEAFIPVTGGAGGVSFNLNFSAAITASLALIELIANAAPVADKSIAISAAVATSLQSAAAVTALDVIRIKATLVAGAAGTVAVAWAQNSSNAAATNFGQGAFMKVTQLS